MFANNKSIEFYNDGFIENKGQWDASILYAKTSNFGGGIFLLKDGFKIVYINRGQDIHQYINTKNTQTPTEQTINIRREDNNLLGYAFTTKFKNSNKNVVIESQNKLTHSTNYLIGEEKNWGVNCATYKHILYKNIYKGIDIKFYFKEGELKYDIIVAPFADVAQVKIIYEGLKKVFVKNEQLFLVTAIDTLTEHIPVSYQYSDNDDKQEVKVRYQYVNNELSYSAFDYDKSKILVIDPSLVFATFTGSNLYSWGMTATYGINGEGYAGGIAFGNGLNPPNGAVQSTYTTPATTPYFLNKDYIPDIVILKFSADGSSLLYATYLGGNGDDIPHSLIENSKGELIVLGRTNSNNLTNKNYHSFGALGGSFDIFLTKLNATGTAILSTCVIGGSGLDGANISGEYSNNETQTSLYYFYGDDSRSDVTIDKNDNVYVVAQTQSTNFYTTPDAFQKTIAGKQDAVFIKLNATMTSVLFSSYLGGKDDDGGFGIGIHPITNNIYIAGATFSDNLAQTISPSIYQTLQGGCDGFISIIDGTTYTLKKTTYLGTDKFDGIYRIQFDSEGNVYVMGVTLGKWMINNVDAQYVNTNGRQIICKIDLNLTSFGYSMAFGTGDAQPNLSPTAFLVDRCQNVYYAGFGSSPIAGFTNAGTMGLTTSTDALQKTTKGRDFYFIVFKKNITGVLYATYYGAKGSNIGDHVDGGTSRYDHEGNVYQAFCASCGDQRRSSYATTISSYAPTNIVTNTARCNILLLKIAFNFAGVSLKLNPKINGESTKTTGCTPLNVYIKDEQQNASSYDWDWNDGTPVQTTTNFDNTHIYNDAGDYNIKITGRNPLACNEFYTSNLQVNASNKKLSLDFSYQKTNLDCNNFIYTFTNISKQTFVDNSFNLSNYIFEWNFGDGTIVQTKDINITHEFKEIKSYLVTLKIVDIFFCNVEESVTKTIKITNQIISNFVIPNKNNLLCTNTLYTFNNTSIGGEKYQWFINNTLITQTEHLTYTFTSAGDYQIKLIVYDENACNKKAEVIYNITLTESPVSNFKVVENEKNDFISYQFINLSTKNASHYKWDFGDKKTNIITTNRDTILFYQYDKSGVYDVCLTAYNQTYCDHTLCQKIDITTLHLARTPDAFTPNNDGINDLFKPFLSNVMIYQMRIFDKAGNLMFETTDKNKSWDGTYNGKPLPSDNYSVIIDVETFDGTKHIYRKNLSLIR